MPDRRTCVHCILLVGRGRVASVVLPTPRVIAGKAKRGLTLSRPCSDATRQAYLTCISGPALYACGDGSGREACARSYPKTAHTFRDHALGCMWRDKVSKGAKLTAQFTWEAVMANVSAMSPSRMLGLLGISWGWLLALGVLMTRLGVIGLGMAYSLTVAAVFWFGILAIVGGIAQLLDAFHHKGWKGIVWHVIIGLIYIVAGVVMITMPVASAFWLTL